MKRTQIIRAILYFGIAVAFAGVRFYQMINDFSGGMVLWRQVAAQPINWMLTILFVLLGILELSEVKK